MSSFDRLIPVLLCIVAGLLGACDAALTSPEAPLASPDTPLTLPDTASGDTPQDLEPIPSGQGPVEPGAGPVPAPDFGPAPDPALCEFPPVQARLLTNEYYDNTVRDLLGTSQTFGAGFPGEPILQDLDGSGEAPALGPRLAEQYRAAAEALSAEAVENLDDLLPCTEENRRCARRFIREFGLRAFRRPVSTEEIDSLMERFNVGAELDFEKGVELVIAAMLQSPSFAYSVETIDEEGRLEPFALAAKLSYFLWNSMPDDELLRLAGSGRLQNPSVFASQAERMVEDERSRDSVRNFIGQWLQLGDFEVLAKSPDTYPEYTPELPGLWQEQLLRFAEEAIFSGQGLEDLMRGDYTFVNDELAALYGFQAPGSDELTRVELPAGHPGGLLGQPGLMALRDGDFPAIHRGQFVLSQFLCRGLPLPRESPEVSEIAPANVTLREHTDSVTSPASCAVCHAEMNPFGHALGEFDGLGRQSTVDTFGFEVDAAVELSFDGEPLSVEGAAELSEATLQSVDLRQCFVRNWYRYAASRLETTADACSLHNLSIGFDGDVRALMLAIVNDDTFVRRAVP